MSRMIDLTGQRFGKLLVLNRVENTKSGQAKWRCLCDCGQEIEIVGSVLRNGTRKDCGRHIKAWNFEDLTGQRFGRLVVLERIENTANKQARWLCQCDCGKKHKVSALNLKNGSCKSCGCYKNEMVKVQSITHGMSKTRLWRIWNCMHVRCEYKSATQYKYYGGRGISVCDEWKSFEPFRDWALANGYEDGLTIDRIDVNKNYEPSNCRWATWDVQANNRTDTTYITYNGETMTTRDWSRKTGIHGDAIRRRLRSGWSIERALTEPLRVY